MPLLPRLRPRTEEGGEEEVDEVTCTKKNKQPA